MSDADTQSVLSLSQIRGQAPAVRQLEALIDAARPVPPLMLVGPPGCGKRSAALAFASALLQAAGVERAKADARIAAAIGVTKLREGSTSQDAARGYPDLGIISVPGRKTRISVLQSRDLALSLATQPFEFSRRIYIVEPADRMTVAAANALLKTLEEPPPYAVLMLVTSAPWQLPITVRSRMRALKFSPLTEDTIADILRNSGYAGDEASLRAQMARGNIERALAVEPGEFEQRRDHWVSLLSQIDGRPARAAALAAAAGDAFGANAADARENLMLLIDVLRDLAVDGSASPCVLRDEDLERLAPHRERLLGEHLATPALIDRLQREIDVFHRNPRLAIQGAVLALSGAFDERMLPAW